MGNARVTLVDANEATAAVAYRLSEVIAIYPITPSSAMGEFADQWAAMKQPNIWNVIPDVVEMQSEGGAAGAVHGALQAGALTTTFTASQGLLLMIPNMFKIAGELTPFVMHVAARTISTHALSIFGDHSDVMACRQTGFAMLASGSVQEAQDLACIAHAATLETRIPFIHFFDGFRTSHEVGKIESLSDDILKSMVDSNLVAENRDRALTPDKPVLRGTAQNPDVFFQSREAINATYAECPSLLQGVMDRFAKLTGRSYHLFDYIGHPEAERVIVIMGSGAETAHETVDWMVEKGEKVGVLKARLFRPFAGEAFVQALPKSVRSVAVLDRTKEPGSVGEPFYLDVNAAFQEAVDRGALAPDRKPKVVGGRYGLSSKEFTPAMVYSIFENLNQNQPKNHFTVGIIDDVTHTSLPVDADFDIEPDDVKRAVFYGLGADGTVGANKNSIKIIGEGTDNFAQGYFVYDSKKSGAMTISHLRFGPHPIRSTYLIKSANFVACHQFGFVEKYNMLTVAKPGATFLLNSPYGPEEVWDKLPVEFQKQIVEKELKFYVVDAYKVARETGMGNRINTIMQTCFFGIADVVDRDEAIADIKKAIEKTYSKRGQEVVEKNYKAVDQALSHLAEVNYPKEVSSKVTLPPAVSSSAPDFIQRVTAKMMERKGDLLPVSAFPIDGTWPVGTTKWEKRNIALEIPVWDQNLCIQCNKCVLVCPHAAIRAKAYEGKHLDQAPESFKSMDFRSKDFSGFKYSLQVAPEDCTGCTLCVMVCPAKDKNDPKHKALNMGSQRELRDAERENFSFFLEIPDPDRQKLKADVKDSQFLEPLFEFSGACPGCGETPYIKLLTQFFGDRLLMANATGCSSIFGGNLPTTPYTTNRDGRGPAWSNSLFEDNAEFGFGFRLAVDFQTKQARELLQRLESQVGKELAQAILTTDQVDDIEVIEQRERVARLKQKLSTMNDEEATRLHLLADYLVKKSVWIVGGDGWAYDIGYGGLDHVLANNRNVNVLVLDTEVYSNTGGQASKSTPLAAAAKFATAGKEFPKKDLGMIAMTYGHIYVAQIAMGAKDIQAIRAFREADSYDGPSLIIAYSHCIAHGFDLSMGLQQQKLAVDSGIWPLYRFDPRRKAMGENPLQLDSPSPKISPAEYLKNENRFRMAEKLDAKRYAELQQAAERYAAEHFQKYQEMANQKPSKNEGK